MMLSCFVEGIKPSSGVQGLSPTEKKDEQIYRYLRGELKEGSQG